MDIAAKKPVRHVDLRERPSGDIDGVGGAYGGGGGGGKKGKVTVVDVVLMMKMVVAAMTMA